MSDRVLAILRKAGSRVVLIASVLASIFLVIWLTFGCPLPFIAPLWHVDVHGTAFNTRYRIADGFVLSGRLNGMSRPEVLAFLGPPPPTDKWEDHGLVYVLGPGRSWASLDYEWLLVDFDSAGRVANVDVVSD